MEYGGKSYLLAWQKTDSARSHSFLQPTHSLTSSKCIVYSLYEVFCRLMRGSLMIRLVIGCPPRRSDQMMDIPKRQAASSSGNEFVLTRTLVLPSLWILGRIPSRPTATDRVLTSVPPESIIYIDHGLLYTHLLSPTAPPTWLELPAL